MTVKHQQQQKRPEYFDDTHHPPIVSVATLFDTNVPVAFDDAVSTPLGDVTSNVHRPSNVSSQYTIFDVNLSKTFEAASSPLGDLTSNIHHSLTVSPRTAVFDANLPLAFEADSSPVDVNNYFLLPSAGTLLNEGSVNYDTRGNDDNFAAQTNIPIYSQSIANSNIIPGEIRIDSNDASVMSKLSEIAFKLDVLIGHQVETNTLLKELVQK